MCRGTAGILLVLPRYCLGPGPRDPVGPAGLVGLGPPGLAPGLKWDEADTAPGLIAGVLVGLLGEGDKWPQGPVSACRNLLLGWEEFRIVYYAWVSMLHVERAALTVHTTFVYVGRPGQRFSSFSLLMEMENELLISCEESFGDENDILFKEIIMYCDDFFFLIEMITVNLNRLILFWEELDSVLKEVIIITIAATWDFYYKYLKYEY